ncbi:MAG TPA: stage II sporulation protein M [Thermoanaerobaculia bacterium]|nr:stage II sporulation protein M [Thermoanaerobaculia bacterium]
MRYERFLELGRGKWEAFGGELDRLERRPRELSHQDLERLSIDYRKILHDHALAGARFPGTRAAQSLQRLAIRANHLLQWGEERPRLSPLHFYGTVFPARFRGLAGELVVCALLMASAALLGLTMTAIDPAVGTSFLGPEAIAGLERGEIWTDQVRGASSLFSSLIATNNMKVAMTAWAGGVIAGLGAFTVLFFNGFMLGAVVITTVHFGMGWALLDFIAAHGPLELSLIVVTAAAGVHIGRAILSPGVVPRGVRVQDAATRSALVLLGCLPWFLVLGLVEGFVSPAPTVSPFLKIAFGLLLEAFFLLIALRPPPPAAAPLPARPSESS